jgi:hypothetical protein
MMFVGEVAAIQRSSMFSFFQSAPVSQVRGLCSICSGMCTYSVQNLRDQGAAMRHAEVAISGRVCHPSVRQPSFSFTLYPSPPAKRASSVLAYL